MASYTVTGDYGTATVTGTAPFTIGQAGGPHGGLQVLNANGTLAELNLGTEAAPSVLAPHARAQLQAIVTDANDEAAG